MQFCRLYTGADGQSHFEELDQTQTSKHFFAAHDVKGLVFKNDRPTHTLGWHNAPRRQWVITLSGSVRIATGDGTTKTFGPGDVFLAEDLTGQGHTAKPDAWVRAFAHME
jgi:hypothetical protein